MKKMLMTMLCLLMALGMGAKNDDVQLKVIVKGYEGGYVMLAHGHDYDTLRADKKGRFDLRRHMERPAQLMLVVDQLRSGVVVYLENGMKGTLTLSFKPEPYEGQTMYVGSYEYKGTKKDCMDFYQDYSVWERNGWPFEKIAQYDFPSYRQELGKEAEALRSRLNRIDNEGFKQSFLRQVNAREEENLIRYAWAKHTVDPDFEKYIGAFERNSMEHRDMAFTYQRWWQSTHRPEQGFTNGSWYMEGLKRSFTSQQMINALASDFMGSYIQRAPKDLSETWEAYCKTCIDKGQIAKLQAKYDKFNPGKDAPDFETTDYEDGKTYTLKDFRGKALMIDCWATWCGPCMAEMPYYAKVVEHFKNDNRIEFIAISFDSDKKRLDKELKENAHPWRQFWCKDAFKSQLAKGYGFNGIPRFIFIDKNGKLIAGDAPKPSSENIIEYIESKLALSDK